MVWILITSALIPSEASFSAASKAAPTQSPVATIVTSVPSFNKTPLPTSNLQSGLLVELGKEHDDLVVLDADLAAATKTGVFQKEFPERHIDCGIAECNMMGIAAGIAATGKVPFVSSFAMFVAGRAFEQVRNSVGYPKLNVKIGATHAGISVGEDALPVRFHNCPWLQFSLLLA